MNELNLESNQNIGDIYIPGYKFEVDELIKVNKTGCIGAWISMDIKYSRCKKLEAPYSSVITLSVGFPDKRKFYDIGYYRQHNLLHRKTKSTTEQKSKSLSSQLKLLSGIITENKEMILIGDINVDMMALYKNESDKTNTKKSQNYLMKIIKANLTE